MEDFDLVVVAKKSVRGVFALISRTFLIQLLSLAANLILSIYLDPASLGIFFVTSSIVVFLNYFQDIGLAASLIQKKEEPTRLEYTTTFTIQQCLVLLVSIPTLLFAAPLASFYNLPHEGYYLLLVLVVSFFLSSLRTIPTIILERRLDFHKLVIPQIGENLVYSLSLIVFAVMGYGLTSFTIAVLSRSIVGLILTYYIQPWKMGLSFDKESFKQLAKFGIPFQANSFLALLKDDLFIVYLGKILPFDQVGIIGFAQKWAFYPLRLIMDNVIKITFPSFSRLQHDKEALKIAIEKSLYLISVLLFPITVAMMTIFPLFIKYFPSHNYGEKWGAATASLIFFSLNALFSSLSTPLTNFLNAIGKVKVTLYLMVFWTVTTWVITPVAISFYGYNGVGLAAFLISLSSFGVYYVAKRYVDFAFYRTIFAQSLASLVMLGFILLARPLVTSFLHVFIISGVAAIVYSILLFLIDRKNLMKTVIFIVRHIK